VIVYTDAEVLDAQVDWTQWAWGERHWRAELAGPKLPSGVSVVKQPGDFCGHETCYDTHDVTVILQYRDRYYRKDGTFNSHDGLNWGEGLTEVFPKHVTETKFVTRWEMS
jgi:hypothetical protein